jgi:phosphohistidine phosphatase
MKVWMVRHAIAHERERARWPDDSLRPLTETGKRKFRKAARGLARLLPTSAPILTSPFVRARQTARILAASAGGKIIECRELAHGSTPGAVFELLKLRIEETVILVGHEPEFGRLLAAMLGTGSPRLSFRKGGAACVEFDARITPGGATLRCFLPPKVLRALR